MLSHDNIYWTSVTVGSKIIGMKNQKEVMISYLPLSHVAANVCDIWAMFLLKGTIIFADKMALRGTLIQTLKEARPTIFFGVPRVYEKLVEGIKNKATETKGMKRKMFKTFSDFLNIFYGITGSRSLRFRAYRFFSIKIGFYMDFS